MKRMKEIRLPLFSAFAAIGGTILDAPNYGPHEGGIMALLLIPMIVALLAMSIGALVRKRWLRLIALLAALAVCLVCGERLERAQRCPECDGEYLAIQEYPMKDGNNEVI